MSYQIDEILLPAVSLVDVVGVAVFESAEELLDFGLLLLVGQSPRGFGLHRLFLNQCIIDKFCRSLK